MNAYPDGAIVADSCIPGEHDLIVVRDEVLSLVDSAAMVTACQAMKTTNKYTLHKLEDLENEAVKNEVKELLW